MNDFFLDNFGWFLVGFVVLLAIGFIGAYRQSGRLMEQCIADGKKEYECHGIIRGRR